jgi:hypothetical protein
MNRRREKGLGSEMPFQTATTERSMSRLILPVFLLLLLLPFASACSWGSPPEQVGPRPYPVSQVHQPPVLLYCSEFRLPARYSVYSSAVQVEFDVTPDGSVTNAEIVEEGMVVSSTSHQGDAMLMARSCMFTPAYHWGSPVAVRMRMWFVW